MGVLKGLKWQDGHDFMNVVGVELFFRIGRQNMNTRNVR